MTFSHYNLLSGCINDGFGTLFGLGDVKLLNEAMVDWLTNGDILL